MDPSPDESLARAFELHQRGMLDEAEALYRGVLERVSEHPAALHFLGLLLHAKGRVDDAVKLLERARAGAPAYVDLHNNLGNIYLELQNVAQAESCFRRVLELDPGFAATHFNLGMLLLSAGRFDDAIASLARAADLQPDDPVSHARLGDACAKKGDFVAARAAFRSALALQPNAADERRKLGVVYFHLLDDIDRGKGDRAAALGYLDEWLDLEPDNPIARHDRAAHSGDSVPARASDGYVKATYDQFAESFDHVLEVLGYRGHELCANALEASLREQHGGVPPLAVLDAGCGTGAFGSLIKPRAGRLVGVDLSPKMLEKASRRQVYDELHEAELTSFLERSPGSFDAVICADALIYFGDLMPCFAAVGGALRPGGRFVFTIEELVEPGGTFRLHHHGRYSHSERYARDALVAAGLVVTAVESIANLRVEFGADVPGRLVVCEKPHRSSSE